MSEALVVRDTQEIAPQTARGILTRDGLKEAAEQRRLLAEYVKAQMVPNTDFGIIPGTDKPTLLKPGAEKLVDLYRCTPKFKLLRVVEDYDRDLYAYTFRVQLYQRDSEAVLAEGYGSANSREGRYRWRTANLKCPACTKETLFRSKHKSEFYCWSKKGGCGATFPIDDKRVTGQEQGKVENEDVATLANTILKMAKKRALVDGAIALARVSDLFTQDVEDTGGHAEEAASPEKQSSSVRGTVTDNGVETEKEKPPPDPTLTSDLAASIKAPAANGKSAGAVAHDLIIGIQKIDNPNHHKNWWPAHEAEWSTLPGPLQKAVKTTYDNWAPGK